MRLWSRGGDGGEGAFEGRPAVRAERVRSPRCHLLDNLRHRETDPDELTVHRVSGATEDGGTGSMTLNATKYLAGYMINDVCVYDLMMAQLVPMGVTTRFVGIMAKKGNDHHWADVSPQGIPRGTY